MNRITPFINPLDMPFYLHLGRRLLECFIVSLSFLQKSQVLLTPGVTVMGTDRQESPSSS